MVGRARQRRRRDHQKALGIGNGLVTLELLGRNKAYDLMAGYGLARLRFPGRDFLFFLFIASLMVTQL